MKSFTTLSFLFLMCSVAVCAGSRNSFFRFQLPDNDIDNTIDKDDIDESSSEDDLGQDVRTNAINVDDEPSSEDDLGQDVRTNAINVNDELLHSTTSKESSGFINPHKAPATFFEYMKETLYGIFSGIYHMVFGKSR